MKSRLTHNVTASRLSGSSPTQEWSLPRSGVGGGRGQRYILLGSLKVSLGVAKPLRALSTTGEVLHKPTRG